MSSIEERVKKIVIEQLGVKEEEVTSEASFVDDLGWLRSRFSWYCWISDGIRRRIWNWNSWWRSWKNNNC